MEKYNKIKHFAELAGCDFYINGETVVLLGNVSLHGEHFNWQPEHLSVKVVLIYGGQVLQNCLKH